MGVGSHEKDGSNGAYRCSSFGGVTHGAPLYSQYPPSYPQIPPPGSRQQTEPKSKKRKVAEHDDHGIGMSAAAPAFIDLTQDSPPRKRRTKDPKTNPGEGENAKPKEKASKGKDEEKRLRRWRKHAPSSYLEVRDRALTQRMFVLDRQRLANTDDDHPTETVTLAGTTGNIYTITVDKVPSCDCPHARKGNQCKHIAYVLSRALRAPAHLEYQLALTSAELRDIFAKAPPLPSETADKDDEQDGNRKAVEGECPICCIDFEPDSGEKVVYCKAACGNNVHAECFQQWAGTKKAQGSAVTCPFCRTPWQSDEIAKGGVPTNGAKNAEGYINVANQLGLSGRRDYTSYNGYWVRQQARNGAISWDDDGVMGHDYY